MSADRSGFAEDEFAFFGANQNPVAFDELAFEDLQRQHVNQALLNHPFQRSGTVSRVVAEIAEKYPGLFAQLHLCLL